MDIRIPMDEHPYPEVEQAVIDYWENLALVFNEVLGCWQIVQECEYPVPTIPPLKGVPGVDGLWCRCLPVFTISDKDGIPLSPEYYCSRILWALDRMDTWTKGGFGKFMDDLENRNERIKADAARDTHDYLMQVAKGVAASYGRIISTPAGTINVDKMYEHLIPGYDDAGRSCLLEV